MEINKQVKELQYSVIRTISEKSAKYQNVINLTIGEPDIPTPKQLILEALELAKNKHFGYPPTAGSVLNRTLAAEHYNKKFGTDFTHENVLFNIGSSEAISSAIKTIINPEDEVIIFAPYYPAYPPLVSLAYGIPIIVDISKNNFKVTLDILKSAVTSKTKAIILSNPCNPTGVVMSYEEIKNICDYISEKDIFIIADEIYNMITFDEYTSFGIFPTIKDKLIITNGFSKSHSMTGWRNGYTIVPKELRQYFLNASSYNVGSPVALSLEMGNIALNKYDEIDEIVAIYKERAEYMMSALRELNYDVVECRGAFYLFVNYEKISNKNSLDFAMDLLEKTQIAVVPGMAFGVEGYVRMALTVGIDKLHEAIERIKNFK
ncbi:MAG: aminotransferase class I/II-fold pyridoxal phosphate-dependent enzyme [Fusobacteriaceae bacterium]|nr:aminotransferase class I/II-fold pyridoxal phosphate-dependent enzyme [Fusobacteriaceae bacterium]